MFKVVAEDKKARAGVLKTSHGSVETPIFMPCGTQGTVKALSPKDLKEVGCQIVLGNTYHLFLRPGSKLIKKMGGLHKFMGWDRPILTDSGGFQAFSLGAMIEHGVRKVGVKGQELSIKGKRVTQDPHSETEQKIPVGKIDEEGVHFFSHLDGSKHLLTPEKSMEVQLDLGADICLVLDELLSPMHDQKYVKESLERTHRWEKRSQEYFKKHLKASSSSSAQLFGIIQGVYDKSIREKEARWVSEQNFDGISIGGSFGTSPIWGQERGSLSTEPALSGAEGLRITSWVADKAIKETMSWVCKILPDNLPRHALGIGEVKNIFDCVEKGIDMFDCVAPTRRARNGSLYISPKNGGRVENMFTLNISRSEFRGNEKSIDPGCLCYVCQNFSRAYLRHLYMSGELLFFNLASIHNVYFMMNLTAKIREAIIDRKFSKLKSTWVD